MFPDDNIIIIFKPFIKKTKKTIKRLKTNMKKINKDFIKAA